MDTIVLMKQIPDLAQIRIKKETREAVIEGVPLIFGDMDKNALEEAVKIKEAANTGKVTVLSMGSPKLKDTVKDALARGADEAVILTDPKFDRFNARGKALILAKAIQKIGRFDLIFLGEGSADNYSGQMAARLAELLNLPLVTYITKLEVSADRIKATRNMEDSVEVVEAPLPAIVSVTTELNKPRISSLQQILKAARKPILEWKTADLGINPADLGENDTRSLSNLAPAETRKNIILEGGTDDNLKKLVNALTQEGVWGR